MGSLRFWLLLAAIQIAILAILAATGAVNAVPSLRWLGYACIVGIFASVPAIVVKSFVAGQLKIGNGHLSMVQTVQSHQPAIIIGVWVMIAAALAMAMPRIRADIAADQAMMAAVVDGNGNGNASESGSGSGSGSSAASIDSSNSIDSSAQQPGTPKTTLTTPGAGSPTRTAILDIVRFRLKSKARFKVDHIKVAGSWAFVRATEVVELDKGELQETDLTVSAMLNNATGAKDGWRIVEFWTLPDEDKAPFATFSRSVRERVKRERLPDGFLPDDIKQ